MRIIIADPNQKTLWALRTLIDEEPEMEVIGEATYAEQLQEIIAGSCADLVLLDRRLPGAGIEVLIKRLHEVEHRPYVIAMSSDTEDSRFMLKAGADAFLSKGERPDWLLGVLRRYARRIPDSREEANR